MKNISFYLYIFYLSVLCSACNSSCKSTSTPFFVSPTSLSANQWHLTSITNSNPAISTYKGTSADSMRFTWKWAYNGNQLLDSIFYYQNGNTRKYSGNFAVGEYDTITCYPKWKLGYGNTIILKTQFGTDHTLIFTVMDSTHAFTETDSLYY